MNTANTSPTPDSPDTPDTSSAPDTAETQDVPTLSKTTDSRPTDTGTTDNGAHHTLADEVFVDDGRTAPLPTTPARTGAATATAPAHPTTTAAGAPPEPLWIKGPAPLALVLGLLGLLVAASVLVSELTDVTFAWGDLGPWSVVVAGLVVLLVGAIGLRSSRARD